MKGGDERLTLLGVTIDAITVPQLHERLSACIDEEAHALVLNVNVNAMNLAARLPWFRRLLNSAEVVFCDGAGVMLGARILGHRIPERITYADWIWRFSEYAEPRGYSFFFLGSRPGVAGRAAAVLKRRFPGLRICGTHHGYFDRTFGSAENEAVLKIINERRPDILLVCFGMPEQERWLMENWDRCTAKIALTGGAVFDYISGDLRRGPRLLTNHGFEWLARLLIEPRRLWRRYLLGNPLFLFRIIRQRAGGLDVRR